MTDHRARAIRSLIFSVAFLHGSLAFAEERRLGQPAPPMERYLAAAGSKTAKAAAHAEPAPSDAERIARLDRSLEADTKRLSELKASLDQPDREYADAQADFEELDEQLSAKKKELAEQKKAGLPADAKSRAEIAALQKQWSLAKDRFDLAIRDRKSLQESSKALEQKIAHDREALNELRDEHGSETPADVPPDHQSHADTGSVEQQKAPALLSRKTPQMLPTHPASASAPTPAKSAAEVPPATEATGEKAKTHEDEEEEPAELVAATAEAEKAEAEADAAEHEAKSVAERIEILQQNIALARQRRETAHEKVDNTDATLKDLNEQLIRKLQEGANTDELKRDIEEATQRVTDARADARAVGTELDDMQSALASLQSEQLAAVNEAEEKREVAEEAAEVVKELNNPFSMHNMLQWTLDHGPRIAAILIAMFVCIRLSRVLEARFVSMIAGRGGVGNRAERENRAKTLLGIFHNMANILILGGGTVVVLQEVGIPVAPFIGGAAVVGLAVAFGAQSLIKDYFTGFLVLLEQQYLINDVVKIGSVSGQVERITLRTTMLRDAEGHVHFIPHGQITTVTNTTHGWSRAVIEVRVGYRENIDRVIEVLMQLARELAASEEYRSLVLDQPTMLGVDAFADSGVVVKFHIKTRPLQQTPIRRELLRRIKNRFDELGIEIPCPQPVTPHGAEKAFSVVAEHRELRAG